LRVQQKDQMSGSPLAVTTEDPGAPAMQRDVIAGLVAAAVVLPKAMAYATVAGLPVAVGL
jgi:MFS superfamily sulfate permease-like transporter